MRTLLVLLGVAALLMLMGGTPVSRAQTDTATPTDTPTTTPTPTSTYTPTPNLFAVATVESGQAYAIEYTVRPMEIFNGVAELIQIGLLAVGVFLLMVLVRRAR